MITCLLCLMNLHHASTTRTHPLLVSLFIGARYTFQHIEIRLFWVRNWLIFDVRGVNFDDWNEDWNVFLLSLLMIPGQQTLWALLLLMIWFGLVFTIWWTESSSSAGGSCSPCCQALLCRLNVVDCWFDTLFLLLFSLSFGNFVSILDKEWSFACVVWWTGMIYSSCVLILSWFLCFSCVIKLEQMCVLADECGVVQLVCRWC